MTRFITVIAYFASTAIASSAFAQADSDSFVDEDSFFNDDLEETSNTNVSDPFEGINRKIFGFNDYFYENIGKPFARTYTKVVPDPVESGIDNFFHNIRYPVRLTGNLMQGRLGQATKETGSFLLDSTVGLGGVIDVSAEIPSLQTSNEDIGQALGKWGVGKGFYIVLPILGPSTLRDFVARFGDNYVDPINKPWSPIKEWNVRVGARTLEIMNDSPSYISIYDRLGEAAIDKYAAMKDGYVQVREAQILE